MSKIKYFGLVGKNIGYSQSPTIHNRFFAEAGRKNCCYTLIDIPDSTALYMFYKKQMENFTYSGINVTIPYKIEIMPFLDSIEENARYIGSVNTVSFRKDNNVLVSTGYNTDYTGFVESLSHYEIDVKGKSAVILGTGGVSRAITKALIDLGIGELVFVSTSPARYAAVQIMSYHEFMASERSFDILVNCTPKNPVTLQLYSSFSKGRIQTDLIYDLNYTQAPGDFISTAEALNIRGINGLYMLEAQARAAQDIWFPVKK